MTKKIFLFIVVLLWAIFALGCSSGWADVPIDAEHFPDDVFRGYFLSRSRLSYEYIYPFDVDRNGILDDEEIARIKSLHIFSGIRDLSGIKFLTSLERLSIEIDYGRVPLATLDVSGMESLKRISFENSSADFINASACTSLESVSLNFISGFNLDGCTAIKNIYFGSKCKLNVVNLTNFTSLEEATVFCDNMSALILRGCSSLKSLHAGSQNRNLTNLDLTGCDSLEVLWLLGSNNLRYLNMSEHKNLRGLDCKLCGLTSLKVDGCVSLEGLSCSENQLIMLDLSTCPKLSSGTLGPQNIERSERLITRTGNADYPYQFSLKSIGIPTSKLKNIVNVFNISNDKTIGHAIYDNETGIASFTIKPKIIRYRYKAGNNNSDVSSMYVNIHIYPATSSDPEITTTSLPDGKIGEPYSKTLEATGTTPFNWSTYDELPDGLTLNSDGKISGTPNESGTFLISVEVSNDVGTDIKAFELLIKANSEDKIEPPIITTNTLPDGVVSEDYMKTLDAYGTTPIIWSVIKNNLPDGLILSSGGEISGTPLKQGIYNFTVQASNDAGINTKDLKIIINLPEIISSEPEPEPTPVITIVKPEITTSSIPSGKVNTAYSPFQLTATGTTPITWEAIDLPSGITCSKSGVLSGTPTRAGNFANVVIIASNSAGSTLKSFIFRIEEATATVTRPSITTQNNLPSATVNEFYRQQFSASGTTPITWSASGLPKGLNFNSSGLMSGIPETSGKFNFSVSAKNSAGTDTKTFSITINAASTPKPTPEPDPTPEPINNDDFDEEFANNMREFLGKENSTPVKNLSSENASINNNVEAPIYWDDENNGEIIALLPEIIVNADRIYLLRVSFDETVEAGSNLKWYSFAQNANSASAKISEIEGEDYVFLDDDGNKIISPTINALNYMNVAVFFEANKKYSPVISALSKKNNNSNNNANNNNNNTVTSSGGGGGGCNFNFGILSAILALTFLIRNVKIQKQ